MNLTPYAAPGIGGIKYIVNINNFDSDVSEIVAKVCHESGTSIEELYTRSRKGKTPICRYLVWHVLKKKHPRIPGRTLGKVFGNYDHSTVHTGIKLIGILKENKNYKDFIFSVERSFLPN